MNNEEPASQPMHLSPAIRDISERYQLTGRESEILNLIAVHGLSNREIAEQCVISEKTVKNHLANIMDKTETRSIRKLLSMLFNQSRCAAEPGSTTI